VDVEKLDASWERAVARWETVKRVWHNVLATLFIPFMLFLAGCLVYVIYDAIAHPAFRKQLAATEMRQLKWYLIFMAVGWVVSKIWRKKKPEETEDDEQPSVQSSKPKSRRKNHRRVQRGR
jgi:hypothetical protein